MNGDGPQRQASPGVWRAIRAVAIVAMLGLLMAAGVARGWEEGPGARETGSSDLALYTRVIDRVRSGDPYYPAITRELRAGNYPLRPFVTVRPPALAVALASLPDAVWRRLALAVLAVLTLAAWTWRLRGRTGSPVGAAAVIALLASGVMPAFVPSAYAFHEVWAGLLIALSLALRRPDAWLGSVIAGTAAVLLRELALPYLLVMALLAWRDGRRTEAAAWIAGIALFAAALAAHAFAVQGWVTAGDPASKPWLQAGGWPFVLQTVQWNALLMAGPGWLGAVLLPLALLGLTGWTDSLGQRLAFTVLGYTLAFAVVGRPDNAYWGLMIAPLWPLGLAMAWPALRRLARNGLGPLRKPAGARA